MATIVIRNMTTDEDRTLVGVGTIGDVKSEIERAMNIPSESQILVSRNGGTMLLDNAMALNVPPNTKIRIFTKTPPKLVEIEIVYMDSLSTYKHTVMSEQTVAELKGVLYRMLGVVPYHQRLTTLQVVMSDDDLLSEYLLVPLPVEMKQVIMVHREPPPPSNDTCCPILNLIFI